jgi:hypothetical protein
MTDDDGRQAKRAHQRQGGYGFPETGKTANHDNVRFGQFDASILMNIDLFGTQRARESGKRETRSIQAIVAARRYGRERDTERRPNTVDKTHASRLVFENDRKTIA